MRSNDARTRESKKSSLRLSADGLVMTEAACDMKRAWQDVYGGSNPKGFTSTLKKNGIWVISFGGGNNFEHGVFCTGGSAKFELLEFKIA